MFVGISMGRQLSKLATTLRALLGGGGLIFLFGPLFFPGAFGTAKLSFVGGAMLLLLVLEAALKPGTTSGSDGPAKDAGGFHDLLKTAHDRQGQSHETAARSRELLDRQSQIIFCRDRSGHLTFVNRAFCEAFGVAADEVVGTDYAFVVLEEEPLETSAQAENPGQKRTVQRIQTAQGPRWFAWEESSQLGDAPRTRDLLWVGYDITEQRTETAMLARAREQAEEASSTKTRLLATSSLAFQERANAIVSAAEKLRPAHHHLRQHEGLGAIESAANELVELAGQMSDFFRAETGRLELSKAPFDLANCANQAIATVSPRAHQKGVQLVRHGHSALARKTIGDEQRLRQVLVNLIESAVALTERGSVAMTFGLAAGMAASSDQATFTFRVEAGSELSQAPDEAELPNGADREPFAPDVELRLSLARKLARAMGGSVEIDAEQGNPIAFTLTLPLATQPATSSNFRGASMHRAHTAPSDKEHRCRILVAEDNPINAMLTDCMVRRAGCTSVLVETGRAAVEAVRKSVEGSGPHFDLVLMDVHMPDLDGLQAVREIRAFCNEGGPEGGRTCPPLVAVTADAYAEHRKACFEAGMNDYLAKPFSWPEFQALLSRWLPRSNVANLQARREDAA